MTVLAILVDPMADVWMASWVAGEKQCGNINDCGPSQWGSNGMCRDLTNGLQCESDDGYQVRDGDSASADRICLPVACPIPSMDGVVAGPDSLHFPQSLFIECAAQLVHPAATGGVHPAGTSHITTTCEALLELSRLLVKACFHALKEVLK